MDDGYMFDERLSIANEGRENMHSYSLCNHNETLRGGAQRYQRETTTTTKRVTNYGLA